MMTILILRSVSGQGHVGVPHLVQRITQESFKLRRLIVGWLVVLMIYIALVIFQPYHDLETGDNQSLNL